MLGSRPCAASRRRYSVLAYWQPRSEWCGQPAFVRRPSSGVARGGGRWSVLAGATRSPAAGCHGCGGRRRGPGKAVRWVPHRPAPAHWAGAGQPRAATAARDAKGGAQLLHRMVFGQGFHARAAFGGGSTRMPSVFFRTSRWVRRPIPTPSPPGGAGGEGWGEEAPFPDRPSLRLSPRSFLTGREGSSQTWRCFLQGRLEARPTFNRVVSDKIQPQLTLWAAFHHTSGAENVGGWFDGRPNLFLGTGRFVFNAEACSSTHTPTWTSRISRPTCR